MATVFNLHVCMFDWGYSLRTYTTKCGVNDIIPLSQGKFYIKNEIILLCHCLCSCYHAALPISSHSAAVSQDLFHELILEFIWLVICI